jgi:O-succinylbenzoate synthase
MLEVTLIPYTLFFRRPAATSRGLLSERPIWFVQARDSHHPDVVGWGECGPLPGLSVDDRPDFGHAIQRVVDAINADGVTLRSAAHHPAQQTVTDLLAELAGDLLSLPSLAFGMEMALLDLLSGGRRLLWNTPFGRSEAGLETHGLIWMSDPLAMLGQIADKVARGHRVIKLKVGALPFEQECELLADIRRLYPPSWIELRLDANGAFTAEETMSRLERLAQYAIAFMEQPIPSGHFQQMMTICRSSPIPICLDEDLIGAPVAECSALLEEIAPQHIIIKPALLGGFRASEQWIAACKRLGIQWWINSLLESNIGLNAICQWTAAIGGGQVHGLGTGQLFANNVPSPLRYIDSQLWIDPAGGE